MTSPHHVGLGPHAMQVDDIVVILYGCQWPVVLRRHWKHYIVIGICYTDGVMHGESVSMHRAEGKADTVFDLC